MSTRTGRYAKTENRVGSRPAAYSTAGRRARLYTVELAQTADLSPIIRHLLYAVIYGNL